MSGEIKIGVVGCMGRMGQSLTAIIIATEGAVLSGGTEGPTHDAVGATILGSDLTVTDDPQALFEASDVVIDFTCPTATSAHAALASKTGTALIVGTTGLGIDDHKALDDAASATVVVQAGNMSVGVNLLTVISERVAAALKDFDAEIVEMHHRHKVDAPSGTALMLGEAVAAGRDVALDDKAVMSREGITGERQDGSIGFATLRGGSVVGDHDVIFAGDGERITLSHRAEDRSLFAKGAVRAALWAAGQKAGRYTMKDVLGL